MSEDKIVLYLDEKTKRFRFPKRPSNFKVLKLEVMYPDGSKKVIYTSEMDEAWQKSQTPLGHSDLENPIFK